MSRAFKRETRYAVIKLKDINQNTQRQLHNFMEDLEIPSRDCVVVESDWPEYEPVWKMIEARMTGKALASREGESSQQAAVPEWRATEKEMPPEFVPVIGFSEAWVDEDFNPDGIRECFRSGDGDDWISSWWYDEQDCYETESGRTGGHGAPTHWQPRPSTTSILAHKERTE